MQGKAKARAASAAVILALGSGLGGCNTLVPTVAGSVPGARAVLIVDDTERDCLGRAMYFESNRSDEEGLLAVGTVVMNRTEAALFPKGICEVVRQRGQFAAGVLTKPMQPKDLQRVADVTDAVLAGERHPKVGAAMYFHTAGRRFHYPNMHYVAVAGGNAFYEKLTRGRIGPEAVVPEAREAAAVTVAHRVPALAYAAAPTTQVR